MAVNVGSAYVNMMVNTNPLRSGLSQARTEVKRAADDMERDLGRTSQSVSGLQRVLNGVFSGIGFGVGISAWRTALGAVQGLIGGVTNSIVGMNSEMENVGAQLMAFTKDADQSRAILAAIRAEADKTPFTFQQMAAAVSGLIPAARQAQVPLMDLIKTAEILAAANPEQGLQGAAFSLREAASGDFTSVIERFNIARSSINKFKAEGLSGIQVVNKALEEMGYDISLVDNLSKTFTGRLSTLTDVLESLKMRATQPIFEVLKVALADFGTLLNNNMTTLQAWADAVGRAGMIVAQDILLTVKMVGQGVAALPQLFQTMQSLTNAAMAAMRQALLGVWSGWGDASVPIVAQVFGRVVQLARDSFLTVKQAWAGEWVSADSIQPLVDFFGRATVEAHTFVETTGRTLTQLRGGFIDFSTAVTAIITDLIRHIAELLDVDPRPFTDAFMGVAAVFADLGNAVQDGLQAAMQQMASIQNWLVGVANQFNKLADAAFVWGHNFVVQFANGIIGGVSAIVDALNYIGGIISYWLEPHSPPKILPDLDKWGQETATVYMQGWAKADFSVFNELSGTIQGYLNSLVDLGAFPKEGVIPTILGTQDVLAQVINQIRDTGKVSDDLFNGLLEAAGPAGSIMGDLIKNYAELYAQNKKVEAAQKDVDAAQRKLNLAQKDANDAQRAYNDTIKRYTQLLDPLQDQLEEISKAQRKLSDQQRATRLSDMLADANDPRLKRLAEIERAQQAADDAKKKADLEAIARGEKEGDANAARLELEKMALEASIDETRRQRDERDKAAAIEEARLEQQAAAVKARIQAVEDERDAAAKAAKERVDAAKDRVEAAQSELERVRDILTVENDVAKQIQDRLDVQKELIDQQVRHNGLVSDQLKLQEQIAKAAEAAAKAGAAGGGASGGAGAGGAGGNLAKPSLPAGGGLEGLLPTFGTGNLPDTPKLAELTEPRWWSALKKAIDDTSGALARFGNNVKIALDIVATATTNPTLAFQKLVFALPMGMLPTLWKMRDGWRELQKWAGVAGKTFDTLRGVFRTYQPQLQLLGRLVGGLALGFMELVKRLQEGWKEFTNSQPLQRFLGLLSEFGSRARDWADKGRTLLDNLLKLGKAEWANPQRFKPWIDTVKFIIDVVVHEAVPAFWRIVGALEEFGKKISAVFTPERREVLASLLIDLTNIIAGEYLVKFGTIIAPLETVLTTAIKLAGAVVDLFGNFLDLVGALKENEKWGWLYYAALHAIGLWIGLNLMSDLAIKFGQVASSVIGATSALGEFWHSASRGPRRAFNALSELWAKTKEVASAMQQGVSGPAPAGSSMTTRVVQNVTNAVTNSVNNVKTMISTGFQSAKDALIWAQLYGEQAMDTIVKKIKIEMPDSSELNWPQPPTVKLPTVQAPSIQPKIDPGVSLTSIGGMLGKSLAGGIASGIGGALGIAIGPAIMSALPYILGALAVVAVAAAAFFVGKFVYGWFEEQGGFVAGLQEFFLVVIPQALGAAAAGIVNAGLHVVEWLVEGIMAAGPMIFNFIKDNWPMLLLGAIAVVFGPLPALIIAVLSQIGPDLLAIGGAIKDFFVNTFTDIVGIVVQRAGEVWQAFVDFKDRIIGAFSDFKDRVKQAFMDALAPLSDMIRHLMEGDIRAAVVDGLKFLYNLFIKFPGEVVGALGGLLGDITGAFTQLGTDLVNTVTGFLTDIWTAISTRMLDVVTEIGTRLDAIRDKFVGWAGDLKTKWDNFWNGVKDAAITILVNFKKGFDDHLDKDLLGKINGWWQSAQDAFLKPWNNARDLIGGILTTFKDNLLAPLRTAGTALQTFGNGVGKVLGWIGRLLGKDMKDETAPVVGGFATGLNVNNRPPANLRGDDGNWRGGMAWVGERGPELMYVPKQAVILPNQMSRSYAAQAGLPAPGHGFVGGLNLGAIGASVMDLIKQGANAPKWLLDKAVNATGWKAPELPGVLHEAAGTVFNKAKDWIIGKVTDWIKTALPVDADSLSKMVSFAEAQMGKPYIWGGGHGGSQPINAEGWDCSGFVSAVLNAGGIPHPRYGIVTAFYDWMTKNGGNGAVDIGVNNPYAAPDVQHVGIRLAGTQYESGGPFGGVGKNGTRFAEWGSPPGIGKLLDTAKGGNDPAELSWRNLLSGKVHGQMGGSARNVPPISALAEVIRDDPKLLTRSGLQRLLTALPANALKFATGGTIKEPVLGVGLSGLPYLVGEAGPEVVTPIATLRDVADVLVGAIGWLGKLLADGFNNINATLNKIVAAASTLPATTPPGTTTPPPATAPADDPGKRVDSPSNGDNKPTGTGTTDANPTGQRPAIPTQARNFLAAMGVDPYGNWGGSIIHDNGGPLPYGMSPLDLVQFYIQECVQTKNAENRFLPMFPFKWQEPVRMTGWALIYEQGAFANGGIDANPEQANPPDPNSGIDPTVKPNNRPIVPMPARGGASDPSVSSGATNDDGTATTATRSGTSGNGVAELRVKLEQTIDTVDGRIITQAILLDPIALDDLTEGVTEVQATNLANLPGTQAAPALRSAPGPTGL